MIPKIENQRFGFHTPWNVDDHRICAYSIASLDLASILGARFFALGVYSGRIRDCTAILCTIAADGVSPINPEPPLLP